MTIQIESAGVNSNAANRASITVNGIGRSRNKNGMNVVVIDHEGTITLHDYDTNGPSASNRFVQKIEALEKEVLVLISFKKYSRGLSTSLRQTVQEQLGSTAILDLSSNDSWCIIARKGRGAVIAEDHQRNGIASCYGVLHHAWHSICHKMEVRLVNNSVIFKES